MATHKQIEANRASPVPEPDGLPDHEEFHHDTCLMGGVLRYNCAGVAFVKLLRYENTARHAFYKALHELKLVQSRRQAQPAPQDSN